MKVWIINPYGNLPGEGWTPYRATWLGHALAARGHEVVWWVSDFEHRSKTRRRVPGNRIDVAPGFSIRIVAAGSYHAHVSLARVRYERTYARNLLQATIGRETKPDVILHVEPALFFSDLTLRLVRHTGARLVVDVLDLWPELFAITLPRRVRPAAPAILWPLFHRRKWFLAKADAFLGATEDYVHLAQRLAPGKPGKAVYIGANIADFHSARIVRPEMGLPEKAAGEVWCVYAGTFGENYDLPSIVECARLLQHNQPRVRFWLAGEGPLRPRVEALIREHRLENAVCLGQLPAAKLRALYAQSDLALSTYVAGSTVSMPLKAFDYLAAGLVLVNSLNGELGRMVVARKLGLPYEAGNAVDLARAVHELAKNPRLRAELRANAAAAGNEFDSETQHRAAVEFLERTFTPVSSL